MFSLYFTKENFHKCSNTFPNCRISIGIACTIRLFEKYSFSRQLKNSSRDFSCFIHEFLQNLPNPFWYYRINFSNFFPRNLPQIFSGFSLNNFITDGSSIFTWISPTIYQSIVLILTIGVTSLFFYLINSHWYTKDRAEWLLFKDCSTSLLKYPTRTISINSFRNFPRYFVFFPKCYKYFVSWRNLWKKYIRNDLVLTFQTFLR